MSTSERIVPNGWKVIALSEDATPEQVKLPVGPLLVPIAVWRAHRSELFRRENEHRWPLGVWLETDEGIDAIVADLDDLSLVALAGTERQSRRKAAVLRERYGYTGEVCALGEAPGVPSDRRLANALPVAMTA